MPPTEAGAANTRVHGWISTSTWPCGQAPCAVNNLYICTFATTSIHSFGPKASGTYHSPILTILFQIPSPHCTLATTGRQRSRVQAVQGVPLLATCIALNMWFSPLVMKLMEYLYMCYVRTNSSYFFIFIVGVSASNWKIYVHKVYHTQLYLCSKAVGKG